MLGLVVFGSRTWMWTIAAPALAASMHEAAICAGVTGTAGFLPGESAEPVTAHEIITLRCMLACLPKAARAATSARRELYASSARNPKLREDALLLLFSLSRTWGGGSGRGLVPQALFCGTGPSRRASHVDLPRKRGEVKRA